MFENGRSAFTIQCKGLQVTVAFGSSTIPCNRRVWVVGVEKLLTEMVDTVLGAQKKSLNARVALAQNAALWRSAISHDSQQGQNVDDNAAVSHGVMS